MQQSQARQELQDTMAQLDAIWHEIRSLSLMNPAPLTRRLMESPPEPASDSNDLHSQATVYARLAESEAVKAGSVRCSIEEENLNYEFESAKGSDIVLEAVVEAEMAHNAKDFFSASKSNSVNKKVLPFSLCYFLSRIIMFLLSALKPKCEVLLIHPCQFGGHLRITN
ncbi:uncharacterized protein LOC111279186 isoform X2 [Durio zibethinus]|uniref:Uncharacterized protein LOC111279186 isoform X2 n=1 Tax=Durio zibethinus TaxID=66656 RepID=A0A6P5X245_DURZI|nr:uncharacterized protein LOC111279186 isoform X2 [Durio zibethinus]